jgi:dihydroneopterin aldolase
MTLFLASVRDAAEAETALAAGADIIDLKEPANGALGAVGRAASAVILSMIADRAPASATVGDLPMQPAGIVRAVRERGSLGVDYVKVGLFPDGNPQACVEALGPLAASIRLIVVVFADRPPDFDAAEAAAKAGIAGIMLDTAGKGSGSLLDHLTLGDVAGFVARARAYGLTVGLAGSLRAAQIPVLLDLEPDVLGFRGALCRGGRTGRLELDATRAVRALIPHESNGNTEAGIDVVLGESGRGVMEAVATWKSA